MTSPALVTCRPEESSEEFIARLVATAPKPDTALADDLRYWLPPVTPDPAETHASAA